MNPVKTFTKHLLCLLATGFCLWGTTATAQQNRLIRELRDKQGTLQQQIAETEQLLRSTKKDVGSQMNNLATLSGQIEERKKYIASITEDMAAVERELTGQTQQLKRLQQELTEKKKHYETSVKYLYRNRSIQEKLMFIFSADNLAQTYRRMRYMREYATYQRLQGEELLKKREQVSRKLAELEEVKKAKGSLLKEREAEMAKLEEQEKEKRTLLAGLQKKQRTLQQEVQKKRREADKLNARIDRLIAIEIENARKRAEEERRREEAARRRAEKERKNATAANRAAGSGGNTGGNDAGSSSANRNRGAAPMENYTLSKADLTLSNDFSSNRGRLPMPITGSYIIASHYGQYAVEGMRNVKLDNKGIDIQGKPGAQARAIFNGRVAAVFQLNGLFNILVRHGAYISVYCNLSTSAVKQGDEVTTRQILGNIFSDTADNGRTVLHFQLRKEREKLNPEPWLNR